MEIGRPMEVRLYPQKRWRDEPSAGSADGKSCSETEKLKAIGLAKRSAEYRLIRPGISDPLPSDLWFETGLWLLTFDVRHESDAVVLFVIDVAAQRVVSVQRVTLDLERAVALVGEVKI